MQMDQSLPVPVDADALLPSAVCTDAQNILRVSDVNLKQLQHIYILNIH